MTELLTQAFRAIGRLPPDAQDEIARALLGFAEQGDDLDTEHWPAILEGLADAERGDFSADEPSVAVSKAFDRHRS